LRLTSFSNNQQSLIGNLSLFPENFQLDTRKLKSVKPTRNLLTFLVTSSLFAAVTTTSAQSTWTGATDNNWSVAGNWSAGVPNATGAAAIFTSASASGYSIVLGDASRTANITFDSTTGSSPYTIRLYDTDLSTRRVLNVGSVTVEAGSHTFLGAKPTGVAGDFRPQNNAVFNIASGTSLNLDVRLRHLAVTNVYSKTGEGTLILSANNGGSSAWQFSDGAGFAIQNGVLRFAASGASGHSANKYIVTNGAAMELNTNFGSVNAAQTISGNGIGNTGAIRSLSGDRTFGATTNTGSLTLAADSSIGVDSGSLNIGSPSDKAAAPARSPKSATAPSSSPMPTPSPAPQPSAPAFSASPTPMRSRAARSIPPPASQATPSTACAPTKPPSNSADSAETRIWPTSSPPITAVMMQ
jgi:hypothetical protein